MNKDNNYLKINNKSKYYCFLLLYTFLYPIAKLIYGKKNNWIICERGNDAQDNGFVFFKYLVQNHPDIRCTYLIKSSSPDFDRVRTIGRTVEYGSFKHFLMVIGCPVKISSHLFGYSPWKNLALYLRRNKTRDVHVFLQHGIIKNYHLGLSKDSCKSLDLFICGAKPEYEYILSEFNYNNSVPQYTGLPRYDSLNNNLLTNEILIMPTWRSYLLNLSDDEFIKSNYYLSWNKLINNQKLLSIAINKKMIIKFYLHNSFQKFSHLFRESVPVEIVYFKDEPVQKLLNNSKLLITDFSSVYFDFAYLNKPIIYYQFDENEYYSHHYEKGYFDYRRDGFGDVCITEKELIKSIDFIASNNFTLSKKYSSRIDRFFEYRDTNNCNRVFNSIMRVIHGK